MLKTITLLMRAGVADDAQALHDANAVAILRQQIRDAAGALSVARRELAIAMAYRDAEIRALDALTGRVDSLTDSARKALADGREDLGHEAAVLIAALEDERGDRQAAVTRFAAEVDRLTVQVGRGQDRLRHIDRGLQTARATEALLRAGSNGRRVLGRSAGALDDAEATLDRLREKQQAEDDVGVALATLQGRGAASLEDRLDAAGYGRPRTDPETVLARLKAQA